MTRFATTAGFAMIFIMAGAFIGSIVASLALMLFAIGGLFYESSPTARRAYIAIFFVAWAASTLWLFWKKRRLDYRWSSENYLHCLKCGYDLRGNQGTRCPECGYIMTSTQQQALSNKDA